MDIHHDTIEVEDGREIDERSSHELGEQLTEPFSRSLKTSLVSICISCLGIAVNRTINEKVLPAGQEKKK